MLHQEVNRVLRVLCYASRTLTAPEKNYSATELELLVIVWSTTVVFRKYLFEEKVTILTDHRILSFMNSLKDSNNKRLIRWALKIQDLQATIIYRKGKDNLPADCLSRLIGQIDRPQPEDVDHVDEYDLQPSQLSFDPASIMKKQQEELPELYQAVAKGKSKKLV